MAKRNSREGLTYGRRVRNAAMANQWQGTAQQEEFLLRYLDPKSPTFGNAYASALESKYEETYAKVIAAPSTNRAWLQEARDIVKLGPEHITAGITEMATNPGVKAGDRLRAYELLGKLQGLFVEKKLVGHINIQDAINELE